MPMVLQAFEKWCTICKQVKDNKISMLELQTRAQGVEFEMKEHKFVKLMVIQNIGLVVKIHASKCPCPW